jgi:hypothetical protein
MTKVRDHRFVALAQLFWWNHTLVSGLNGYGDCLETVRSRSSGGAF